MSTFENKKRQKTSSGVGTSRKRLRRSSFEDEKDTSSSDSTVDAQSPIPAEPSTVDETPSGASESDESTSSAESDLSRSSPSLPDPDANEETPEELSTSGGESSSDVSLSGGESESKSHESADEQSGEDSPPTSIPQKAKPPISTPWSLNPGLQSRLADLLPRLRQANEELGNAEVSLQKRMDDVADDDGHYIEMNLGLGVLKERARPRPRPRPSDGEILFREDGDGSGSGSGSSSSSSSSGGGGGGDDEDSRNGLLGSRSKSDQIEIMQDLMGKKVKRMSKPVIEDLDKG